MPSSETYNIKHYALMNIRRHYNNESQQPTADSRKLWNLTNADCIKTLRIQTRATNELYALSILTEIWHIFYYIHSDSNFMP